GAQRCPEEVRGAVPDYCAECRIRLEFAVQGENWRADWTWRLGRAHSLVMPSHDASTPVRVGLLGYGLAGSAFHAPLIVATPALRLEAIVTRDSARRAQAEHDHPRARVVETAHRLWEMARDLDLVVVATPNRTHATLAREALEAGIAVVVDKPFAPPPQQRRPWLDDARPRCTPSSIADARGSTWTTTCSWHSLTRQACARTWQ